MSEPTLGVALISYNAAARLAQCLTALSFADEIVLVDNGSTDATLDIAKVYGVRVVTTTDWKGFGVQKNLAINLLKTDWILSIDTDEIVSPLLATSIHNAIRAPKASVYRLARLSNFCGQWVHHSGWNPDWVNRLFKRGSAKFSQDLVHESLIFEGVALPLEGKLFHYSYDNFEMVLHKANTYSTAGAKQRFQKKQSSSFSKAIIRGFFAFLRTYFLKLGFLDGKTGLMIAIFNAETVYYRFLKLHFYEKKENPK